MIRFTTGLAFSLGLLLATLLILAGLVPVYDGVQSLAQVEESTGYSKAYLHEANKTMRDYLYGFKKDMFMELDGRSLFGGQEVFHMAEVKRLFTNLARASLVFLLASLALSLIFKTRIFRDQFYAMLGLLIFLALAGAFFDKAFVLMHGVFFDNELWLFPWDSQLIRLLPQEFFFYFSLLIIGVFVLVSGLIYLIERKYYDLTSR